MINIRYHIVSITAVFLALGIGVALGSTFLDGATVDVLNRNITDAETRIREGKDRIAELEREADDAQARDDALILLGTDRLLAEQLADQPVLVVAEPDVDDGDLDALRSVLERSGADLRGTLEVSDRLAFDGDEVDAELAADLGLEDPTPAELRDAVDAALVDALAAAGAPAPEPSEDDEATTTTTTTATTSTTAAAPGDGATTTTAPPATTTTTEASEPAGLDGDQPEIITTLLDRGYLELQPGPGRDDGDAVLAETGYRYVYLGSGNPDDGATDLLYALLPAGGDGAALPVVVAAGSPLPTADGEDANPSIVARVREDDERSGRYTTVDDIETFSGLAATVFSVADLGAVPVGHYGQADGASAVLPPNR